MHVTLLSPGNAESGPRGKKQRGLRSADQTVRTGTETNWDTHGRQSRTRKGCPLCESSSDILLTKSREQHKACIGVGTGMNLHYPGDSRIPN